MPTPRDFGEYCPPYEAYLANTRITLADLKSWVEQIVQQELQHRQGSSMSWRVDQQPYDDHAILFYQIVADAALEVPAEEWEAVPHDASEQVDRYLYGGQ